MNCRAPSPTAYWNTCDGTSGAFRPPAARPEAKDSGEHAPRNARGAGGRSRFPESRRPRGRHGGHGRDLAGVVDLEALGGLVTKAVSPEPRAGAPSPRVAEFDGGMINAVGLANPGVSAVRREHLPRLASAIPGVRKIANIVGFATQEFAEGVAER